MGALLSPLVSIAIAMNGVAPPPLQQKAMQLLSEGTLQIGAKACIFSLWALQGYELDVSSESLVKSSGFPHWNGLPKITSMSNGTKHEAQVSRPIIIIKKHSIEYSLPDGSLVLQALLHGGDLRFQNAVLLTVHLGNSRYDKNPLTWK